MDHQPEPVQSTFDTSLWSPRAPRWLTELLRVAALALFAAPLFFHLGLWDLRNDESIYSYAVDRILETGDWLTPQSIPGDNPFLEKPPLKFWLVAGAMRVGLTPRNEVGMRVFDALFGLLAFGYVFALGRRVAGPVCGFVALFVLFTLDPLLFEHGLRSNNMEGALVLGYCGGMYHFAQWTEQTDGRRRRRHAFAFAGYFVLAFMTKFVAAIFLPLAAAVAFLLRPGAWSEARARWAEWIGPAVVTLLLVAPWFVYQALTNGDEFWSTIFSAHVYQRFTSYLDPAHLHPWHYYFSQTWLEFGYAGSLTVTSAGLLPIAWHAWSGRPWLARVLVVWWLVPLLLISLGTSKLYHYAYPFLPPLAIGAGWISVLFLRAMADRVGPFVQERLKAGRAVVWVARRPRLSQALLALAVASAVMALWTYLRGEPVTLAVGDVRLFRNSSVLRPIVIAGVLLALVGRAALATAAAGVLLLLTLMPMPQYSQRLYRMSIVDRPLHAIRDCLRARVASGEASRAGIYVSDPGMVAHPYSYYLRPTGPWEEGLDRLEDEARVRLFQPGSETPVIVSRAQLLDLRSKLGGPGTAPVPGDAPDPVGLGTRRIAGFETEPGVVMLLPGPYMSCVAPALAAGGHALTTDKPGDGR